VTVIHSYFTFLGSPIGHLQDICNDINPGPVFCT